MTSSTGRRAVSDGHDDKTGQAAKFRAEGGGRKGDERSSRGGKYEVRLSSPSTSALYLYLLTPQNRPTSVSRTTYPRTSPARLDSSTTRGLGRVPTP